MLQVACDMTSAAAATVNQRRVQQLTSRIGDSQQAMPAIAAILFHWIRMKVVQQLTCLT